MMLFLLEIYKEYFTGALRTWNTLVAAKRLTALCQPVRRCAAWSTTTGGCSITKNLISPFMLTQFLSTTGYASRRRWAPVTFASSCSRCAATTPSSARPPSARCPSATASASTCRGGGSRKMPACKEGWRRWGLHQKMLSTPSAMYLMSVGGKS